MPFHRYRTYVLVLVAIFFVPLLLWLGVILVAPTGWAKRQLVAVLEARTGRSVHLDKVSVCVAGGIRLTNLQIGSPQSSDDPWLHVARLRLDISPFQLFVGKLQPAHVEVDGAKLRVLRRADGSLELADLIEPTRRENDVSAPSRAKEKGTTHALFVHVRHGEITVIDEPTQTRLHLQNVEAKGLSADRITDIDELTGTLNGGPIRLAARFDRSTTAPALDVSLRAHNVGLDQGMRILRYAVPVLASTSLDLRGTLHCDLNLKGHPRGWQAFGESLEGHGSIALDSIDLGGASLIAELTQLGELSSEDRVSSIASDFVLKDRRISSEHVALRIGRVPLAMKGWTDFDGRIDYQIKMEKLAEKLPAKAQRLLGDLNLDIKEWTTLNLRGTVDSMVVQVGGMPLDRSLLRDVGLRREDREKLRTIGRQLRDRILR